MKLEPEVATHIQESYSADSRSEPADGRYKTEEPKTSTSPSGGRSPVRTAFDSVPVLVRTAVSVVIPVYNEASTIGQVIERVLNCDLDVEVIVVDDASTDGTRELLKKYNHPLVKIIYKDINAGKGAALRSGFALASKRFVFVQDADLEYDPRDFAVMLPPLIDGRADMVFGSRFLGGPQRVMFFWHYVGNRFLTLVSNMVTNLNLSDMETGQKAFVREKLIALKLTANRFTFEPEITGKAARAKWRIYEVPVSYSGRTYEEGKKIGWRDAIAALWAIIYYRFFD